MTLQADGDDEGSVGPLWPTDPQRGSPVVLVGHGGATLRFPALGVPPGLSWTRLCHAVRASPVVRILLN